MASIFLSYSRADRPKAQIVAEALMAEGLAVWWDKVLRAGQTYDEVTEGMLREADVVIVLWSATSVKSKWVRAEATLGQRTSVLIPAMIEDAERPIMFELTQSADLIGWNGDRADPRWREFVADVRRVMPEDEVSAAAVPVTAPAAPVAPATAPTPDMTMELTFWTSIKDDDDAADFEAYLKRYPNGHYADLARNRLAAIARAEAKAAAVRPAVPAPAPRIQPVPPPPSPPKPAPPPQRAAPPPAKKSSSPLPIFAGGLVAIVLAGFAISQLLPQDRIKPVAATAVVADDIQVAAATVPEPAAPEDMPVTETVSLSTAELVPAPEVEEIAPEPAPPCDYCPDMVALAGGTFMMGSATNEPGREPIEGPQHEVTLAPFEISRGEITGAQWTACVESGGCNGYRPNLQESGAYPVASVSWRDANAYAAWLSNATGDAYRLPTEAEWEYAARGGTTTSYWWGDRFDAANAPRDRVRETTSLPENPFGLMGMLGNLSEWVEDCYVNGYADAPTDGSAVLSGDCSRRVVRGGSVKSGQGQLRAANRSRVGITTRDRHIGFRVVRSVPPS